MIGVRFPSQTPFKLTYIAFYDIILAVWGVSMNKKKNIKDKIRILKVLKEMLYYAGGPIIEDDNTNKVKGIGTRAKRNQVV